VTFLETEVLELHRSVPSKAYVNAVQVPASFHA
jgi:hypothetical protein